MYTVRQPAQISGVTVRTLHHYDKIGLLKPSAIGDNGYRYYAEDAVYRLQQILFYRELEVPLVQIKSIVSGRDFDVTRALEAHRAALQSKARRIDRLIQTIDLTRERLKGTGTMTDAQLFKGFNPEEQERFAVEAGQRWGHEEVQASNRRWKQYPVDEKRRILDEGNALFRDLAAAMDAGAASPQVQDVIARWHIHLRNFWDPSDEQLLGLTDLYNEDPRFRANYEAVKPGLAGFMREAIRVYVQSRR